MFFEKPLRHGGKKVVLKLTEVNYLVLLKNTRQTLLKYKRSFFFRENASWKFDASKEIISVMLRQKNVFFEMLATSNYSTFCANVFNCPPSELSNKHCNFNSSCVLNFLKCVGLQVTIQVRLKVQNSRLNWTYVGMQLFIC